MAPRMESLHTPLHEPLQSAATINFDNMTDDELMAFLSRDETSDKYDLTRVEPDGMKYQWVRCEVFGQPDRRRPAEMEQRGWRPVPQKRHDGLFMPPGTDGPIVQDGMMVMELPVRVWRAKRELASRVASDKVKDMNAQLAYTPPGTGPRGTHQFTQTMVKRESGSTELQVE